MSLYDEITESIDKDIYGEIPEIEVTLSITVFGESDFDPLTGVDDRTDVDYPVRAIKLEDNVGENINFSTKNDAKVYLIMNEDLNGLILRTGMVVDDIYEISGLESDPITVSWIVTCRLSKNVI